jgi:hypothetical protein
MYRYFGAWLGGLNDIKKELKDADANSTKMDNNNNTHSNSNQTFVKSKRYGNDSYLNDSYITTECIAAFSHYDTVNCFYVRLLGDRYCEYKVCKTDYPESYSKLQQIKKID